MRKWPSLLSGLIKVGHYRCNAVWVLALGCTRTLQNATDTHPANPIRATTHQGLSRRNQTGGKAKSRLAYEKHRGYATG